MKLKYILIVLLLTVAADLSAQSAQKDSDRFFYGFETDNDLMVLQPENSFSNKGIQYGAILSPVYLFEDNSGGQLGSYMLNAKIWAKSYLWSNSFFYIRGKESYLGIAKHDGVYSSLESDNVIDLDMAYLSMSTGSGNFNLSAGRKFYSIGSGLVLDGRGDGGEITWNGSFLSIKILGLYTGLMLKDNNPYGLSDRDLSDGSKRVFAGGTADAELLNQKIYLFGLVQKDYGDDDSSGKSQYNSQYYGAGVDGIVFENLSYSAEFVYERGTSYIAVSEDESTIAAYAVNSGIYYFIPVIFNPTIILQYAYGSGDKDRQTYTNSLRPQTSDGDDTGFISFGSFSGGYALKPKLSNIHVMRGGFSFVPFSGSDSLSLKKMTLAAKYSYYRKDKKESGINSGEATNAELYIGQGVDVSLRWQMFYDLSLYVNYGLFLPGKAYEDDTAKNFVMAGINLSI